MTPNTDETRESEPLEFFQLARQVQRGVACCSEAVAHGKSSDIAYLWIQLGPSASPCPLSLDDLLNIVDEAASLGVNWLVVSLGDRCKELELKSLCQWAQETHRMVVCVHTPNNTLENAERALLGSLRPEMTYLLVDPEFEGDLSPVNAMGVQIAKARPASQPSGSSCDYPNRMIFVDPSGRLYTCGLVAGENEFLLGNVFSGNFGEIMSNPRLPHSISVPEPRTGKDCSGCPPLVARYLCGR